MARVTPRAPAHSSKTDERPAVHAKEHVPVRTRRRKNSASEDMFYIPLEEIPPGLTYEWKRWSLVGENNPFYIADMRGQGWEPVNPKVHPTWLPPGYNEPHIIKGGMILMERPEELTLEAKKELDALAKTRVREAEQRLGMTPNGQLSRDLPDVAPKIVKEYMRSVQVED
jgi:hypothetical protein